MALESHYIHPLRIIEPRNKGNRSGSNITWTHPSHSSSHSIPYIITYVRVLPGIMKVAFHVLEGGETRPVIQKVVWIYDRVVNGTKQKNKTLKSPIKVEDTDLNATKTLKKVILAYLETKVIAKFLLVHYMAALVTPGLRKKVFFKNNWNGDYERRKDAQKALIEKVTDIVVKMNGKPKWNPNDEHKESKENESNDENVDPNHGAAQSNSNPRVQVSLSTFEDSESEEDDGNGNGNGNQSVIRRAAAKKIAKKRIQSLHGA
eukprot:1100770_1